MGSLVRERNSHSDAAVGVSRSGGRDALIGALLAGGDSRTAIDQASGSNKYLCPPHPTQDLTCLASCTASPIGSGGFARAGAVFDDVVGAASRREREEGLRWHRQFVEARLIGYFAASGLARAILCPSGTDAMLTAAMLLYAERPGTPVTAILPCAEETGTGVPLAVACRQFDGPGSGTALLEHVVNIAEIPIRTRAGAPRAEDELNAAYAAAVSAAPGRPVVYLTHGTKTGLIAPTCPRAGQDVIVDACQGRIAPATVAAYLRRGWPVVVTGSKFFGGPAFAGAVLFPSARAQPKPRPPRPEPEAAADFAAALGTVLRWTAALAEIDGFERRAVHIAAVLRNRAEAVAQALAANAALVPVDGLASRGPGWADLPSIFTFAVRDARQPDRLLTAAELRGLYRQLAEEGFLLGQPVSLGGFGGLRLALGARDLGEAADVSALPRLFDALAAATMPAASGLRR